MTRINFIAFFMFAVLAGFPTVAQTASSPFATEAAARYWMQPDVVYGTANNTQLKLDIWYPNASKTPTPTLVYIHGGGWIFGIKEASVLEFIPFLEKGWRVVNVEYRMASNSLAPAAVEDTRCALRWVFQNAKQWNFDTSKIVLTGHSAGGHLSLITGMLPDKTPFDNNCYGDEKMPVAAIINWYGISDVNDIIQGPNLKNYAVMWMGSQPNATEVARSVSPLTYVRPGLPPVLSIHGDKDSVVPYSHSVRLHEALDKANVKNQLFTIKGGDHGGFPQADYVRSYAEIWKFLKDNKIAD
ncbi:MAG: alpha/beta hydrolase [Saprospiraceae bacterium]|nr:alpha/beta hydrolase [Pyrinomonadaceae bacterium]